MIIHVVRIRTSEMAQWRCLPNGNWLGTPDLSECVSPKTTELKKEVTKNSYL